MTIVVQVAKPKVGYAEVLPFATKRQANNGPNSERPIYLSTNDLHVACLQRKALNMQTAAVRICKSVALPQIFNSTTCWHSVH